MSKSEFDRTKKIPQNFNDGLVSNALKILRVIEAS